MSTLKVNNLQVGQDSTATNNLTWFQPGSPDGTIRLGSGNAGSATTKFTFDKDGNLTCVGDITANSIIAPIEGTLDDWIVHAGDTDTKIGFPSDNAVDIYAGGKQVRLTSDGHLGINRTTPVAPITARRLDAGGTGTNGVIAEFANSSGYGVWFGQASASGAAWGATTGDFYWNTGGLSSQVERLRITSTGQFHMGGGNSWTYANQKFVVVEPSNNLGMLLQGNNANEGVNLTLQNIVNANNAYSSLSFADDGGQIFGVVRGKVIDKNANTGELQLWTSGSQKLTIDKDGNVMIGRTSASKKFNVRETSTSSGVYYNAHISGSNHLSGYAIGIGFDPEGYAARTKIGIVAEGTGSGYSRGKLHFLLDSANDSGEATLSESRMTILDDGKVGISVVSPSSPLEVENKSTGTSEVNKRIAGFYKGSTSSSSDREGYIHLGSWAAHYGVKLGYYNEGTSPSYHNAGFFISTVNGNQGITNHTKKFIIKSDGKVAIGNESPQQLLHVWPDTANTTSAYVRVTAGDRNSNTGLDLGHDASGNGHVNMVSNGTLSFSTNNAPRIKISNSSAATSIGGSMTFNALLTTQGDVSGGLLLLKAAENTNRFFVSGSDSNGVELNLYDQAGAQKGILGVSSSEFFIKAGDSSTNIKFHTNSGSPNALVERIRFNTNGGINLYKTHCNRGIIWIHDGEGGSACSGMANVQQSGGRGIVSNKIFNIPANTTTDLAKSHWGGLVLVGWAGTGHQGFEQVAFGYGGTPSSQHKRTWVGNLTVTYTMSAYTLRISHNASNALDFWCILIGV